jgi:hypothetical protein
MAGFRQFREDSCQKVGKELANPPGLDQVTASLRARGIKGSLSALNGRLFWRCTATDRDGIRKSRRVPLRLQPTPVS